MELSSGKNAPELVNAFVEIPMGSNIKYEYDPENKLIKVDRILYTSMSYPFNYGFIPGTLGRDGDPLDILILSDRSFVPGVYLEVKPVGVLLMKDEEGEDSKVVTVPKAKISPTFADLNDVSDVPEHIKKKIVHFFEHYKELEANKWVKITGWADAAEAKKQITEAIENAKK